ncbi:MAG: hypothetical protein GX361_06490 [Bacteroidales bacterium]|nr:hypothetical protein [Bacteroidales bacterium]
MKTKKKIYFILLSLLFIPLLSAQNVGQYGPEDMKQLRNDLAKGTYDVYELKSEGEYVIPTILRPKSSFTIKAAPGLATKPILSMASTIEVSSLAMFEPRNENTVATFDGLEIVGTNPDATAQPMLLYARKNATNCKVIIKNSYVHSFSENNTLRFDVSNCDVEIENSVISNIKGKFMNFFYGVTPQGVEHGGIKVTNTVFNNFTDKSQIVYYPNGTAKGTTAIFDHCTFINSNSKLPLIMFRQMEDVVIKNSVFHQVNNGVLFQNAKLDYCYLGSTRANATKGKIFPSNPAPVFTDPENMDFEIKNKTSFVGNDGEPLGATIINY